MKIWADDGTLPPAISKPKKVSIVRSYRATAIKTKPGTSYHHTTESALVRGGDCFVHTQGGYLQVDCHGGRMSVFYRWGLGQRAADRDASFVIDNANNECGPARRSSVGHSSHESFLTVTDSVSGITSCRIVTAKITYSYLEALLIPPVPEHPAPTIRGRGHADARADPGSAQGPAARPPRRRTAGGHHRGARRRDRLRGPPDARRRRARRLDDAGSRSQGPRALPRDVRPHGRRDADRGVARARRSRVRRGPRRRRHRLRRGPVRARAAPRARARSRRGGRGGAGGFRAKGRATPGSASARC